MRSRMSAKTVTRVSSCSGGRFIFEIEGNGRLKLLNKGLRFYERYFDFRAEQAGMPWGLIW